MYDKNNLSKLIGMMTTRPLDIIIDNNELSFNQPNFEQGVIIIATKNALNHG